MSFHLAPVVQKVDNAIHRINQYPVDSVQFVVSNTFPVDSVIHPSTNRRADLLNLFGIKISLKTGPMTYTQENIRIIRSCLDDINGPISSYNSNPLFHFSFLSSGPYITINLKIILSQVKGGVSFHTGTASLVGLAIMCYRARYFTLKDCSQPFNFSKILTQNLKRNCDAFPASND